MLLIVVSNACVRIMPTTLTPSDEEIEQGIMLEADAGSVVFIGWTLRIRGCLIRGE